MSDEREEIEFENESGEDQSEEASRSSRRSSRSKTRSESADKRSRSQRKKAAKQEKMRQVVSATIHARLMREAPENGPYQPRRESGGSSRSSRSRSSKTTPQFSKPNRSSEDEKPDEDLSESRNSVISENASSVSRLSKSSSAGPLENQDGEAEDDGEMPILAEEEDDEDPDLLEILEKDIETGCGWRKTKIQTEFSELERALIQKS